MVNQKKRREGLHVVPSLLFYFPKLSFPELSFVRIRTGNLRLLCLSHCFPQNELGKIRAFRTYSELPSYRLRQI